MSDVVKIFALGGLDENGKNMYIVEINNDIFVLEAGMK
jgi:ribonuclease J